MMDFIQVAGQRINHSTFFTLSYRSSETQDEKDASFDQGHSRMVGGKGIIVKVFFWQLRLKKKKNNNKRGERRGNSSRVSAVTSGGQVEAQTLACQNFHSNLLI